MAEITSRKMASSKDPLFGIDPENIAKEITERNWKEKATVRITPDERWIYLWIDKTDVKDKGKMYEVQVKVQDKSKTVLKRFFELPDALAYANTEKGRFKDARRPNSSEEIPNVPKQGQFFFSNLNTDQKR